MVRYPTKAEFHAFIEILKEENYPIKRYLPPIDKEWYKVVSDCVDYVKNTSHYENLSFIETCARLLYKVAKRHELGDGNKRTSVIVVYLFCLINDYYILEPSVIKQQAKRAAATKGRLNELTMRTRVSKVLEKVIEAMPPQEVPL